MQIYKPLKKQKLIAHYQRTMLMVGLLLSAFGLYAQISTTPIVKDTTKTDSLFYMSARDSAIAAQTYETATFQPPTDSVKISKTGLDAPVNYSAKDSMIYDIANEKVYLYGAAKVEYETMTIEAGYIVLDWASDEVFAEGFIDSTGNIGQFPQFKDQEQNFTAKRMRYNFETSKGIIYEVTTTQQNLYVLGTKSKFVRTEKAVVDSDSTYTEDVVYSEDAIFTTCNHPVPHFGIRSTKQKVIPNKMIIAGPSRLEVAGVPTPLYLPFAFFPTNAETNTAGLIFPRNYEYSEAWGFGLRDIQYYFPVNDYLDLVARGSIYLKGTFDLGMTANFRRRYKYNGSVNMNYARQRSENNEGVVSYDPSIAFRVNLNQAAGAHPTRRIGGNINIQFNSYQSQNFNDAQSVLQNAFNSNFSLNQSFREQPFDFSVALTHSQNARSGQMTINFPQFNFQTRTIYPFKRRKFKEGESRKERWYEQIAFRYQNEIRATVVGSDTLSRFFDSEEFNRNLRFGAEQRATANTSIKLFKYISVTPSINYRNAYNNSIIDTRFLNEPKTVFDTFYNEFDSSQVEIVERILSFGQVITDTLSEIRPIHELGASVNLTTTLYRTLNFKGKWLRGIRHTLRPSVSMNWSPDYTEGRFDYTDSYFEQTSNGIREVEFSPYRGALFRAPSGESRASIGYSLNNIYEAKYFSKKDSTEKKLKLFENFVISGNYNLAADSLNFSDINARGVTRLFKGITSIQLSARWSPYALNETGSRRINTFYRSTPGGSLLRFDQANLQVSTRLSVKQIRDFFEGKESDRNFDTGSGVGGDRPDRREEEPQRVNDYESLGDWLANFRLNHNFAAQYLGMPEGDTLLIRTNSINVQGRIQMTQNWSLNVGNFGYDFKNKGFSYPSFGLGRNLHCWDLQFQWFPTRNAYTLTIGVKDTPLDFIRIPSIRNQADGARFPGIR
ncbi:MAG: putative LPS assembly protein LptD [Bacteroidota bacterium]